MNLPIVGGVVTFIDQHALWLVGGERLGARLLGIGFWLAILERRTWASAGSRSRPGTTTPDSGRPAAVIRRRASARDHHRVVHRDVLRDPGRHRGDDPGAGATTTVMEVDM
jgi:hypothetical protein